MNQKIIIFSITLFCFFSVPLTAQEDSGVWSLEKCISYAVENSLQVQQTELSMEQAKLNKKQAFWAQFPTLNASFRHGFNFGRSVDPTSYTFVNQTIQSSNVSLNLNQPIFQGLRIRNSIKQSKVDLEAASKDSEQARNDVALQVAQAYLSILLAQENLEVLREQANVTKAQYDQTIKLIDAGVVAENSKYDLEAQMARDDESIVNAENSVELAYTNIKVLMNVDVAKSIRIQKVDKLEVPETMPENSLDDVYQEAINSQPNITASKLREQSADIGVRIAKGALYPTVSFYGGVSTNFSSASRNINGNYVVDTLAGTVLSSSDAVEVYDQGFSYTQGDVVPYFSQLGGNASANIGINISIPIFNQMQTRLSIQRAKLAVKTAEFSTRQLETTLKSNIDRAIIDVKAAAKRLQAAKKSVVATRLSVKNTRKRYELGVVNSFELTSVQNTLIASESNLLQAKYDYLFKLKILDYYKGDPIRID